jgi:hypothetical protein
LTTHPDCRRCLLRFGRAELGPLPPPSPPCSFRCSSASLRAAADEPEHCLLQEGVWRRATPHPKCRRRLFAFGPGPQGSAGAAAPPPQPFFRSCCSAPLRVVADEHCLPQEGECLRSTTHPDCRSCLFAGLSRSRCPRAGPTWSLRRGRRPAAFAVPLLQPLRSAAGGRRRALPAPRGGVSPFHHAPRLP